MSNLVELRGDIDAEIVSVIDAVVQARVRHGEIGVNRMTVVRDVLHRWFEFKVDEAIMVVNVSRGNGSAMESHGKPR